MAPVAVRLRLRASGDIAGQCPGRRRTQTSVPDKQAACCPGRIMAIGIAARSVCVKNSAGLSGRRCKTGEERCGTAVRMGAGIAKHAVVAIVAPVVVRRERGSCQLVEELQVGLMRADLVVIADLAEV